MKTTKEPTTSKEKILMCACQLFSEKGYKGTTIREICKEAETYQISVNYYFQGKENLLYESLIKAYELSSIFELNKNAELMTPEEFIEHSIKLKINSFFDNTEKSLFFKILSKCFFEQIELPEEVMSKTLGVYEKLFKNALRELTKNEASEEDIEYGYFLVKSQLFTMTFHPLVSKKILECGEPDPKEVQWFIEKIKATLYKGLENINISKQEKNK